MKGISFLQRSTDEQDTQDFSLSQNYADYQSTQVSSFSQIYTDEQNAQHSTEALRPADITEPYSHL